MLLAENFSSLVSLAGLKKEAEDVAHAF